MYKIDKDFNEFIKEDELLDYEELKNAFLIVINKINDDRLMNIICEFPKYKPIINFKTLYYILEEFKQPNELDSEFNTMVKFIDKKIDIFMLVNYLKK